MSISYFQVISQREESCNMPIFGHIIVDKKIRVGFIEVSYYVASIFFLITIW